MELIVGDLVKHRKHGFYGIVLVKSVRYGQTMVCRVQWAESNKCHLIDVDFLDKLNK